MKIIAFAVPILILLGMTISPLLTIMMGQEIKLQTSPIDPTNLFRGDYVRLNYEIETVHESKLDIQIKDYFLNENSKSYSNKPLTVYSILKKENNGVYSIDKVVMKKPDNGIYLKGKIRYLWLRSDEEIREYTETEEEFVKEKANQTANIDYNLDNYFVPENTGMELENASNEGQAVATIKVRDGKSILTKVEIAH